ncbi:MAG: small, acid-soluble spore protein, alpha/beta type [Bacillota bacterium]
MANSNNNRILVKGAQKALDQFKQEVAAEIGIQNYMANGYGGDLPSKVNGSVGGYMVKKMIALAESQITNQGTGVVNQFPATTTETYGAQELSRQNRF